MFYGNIKNNDIANGSGVRVTLFVSGCRHCCKGCFQPETWNFHYGKEFSGETENEIIQMLSPYYIKGLTLLGGEPFEPENQSVLVEFLQKVKDMYKDKDIWVYSGYTYEQLIGKEKFTPSNDKVKICDNHPRTSVTDKMLSLIDVLVDGEFRQEEKDISLNFRGSKNQRIIDLNKTREIGKVVLHQLNN